MMADRGAGRRYILEADAWDEKVGAVEDDEDNGDYDRTESNDEDEERSYERKTSEENVQPGRHVRRRGSGGRPRTLREKAASGGGQGDVPIDDTSSATWSSFSNQDDQRLLGAFLLAADGGLQSSVRENGVGEDEDVQLPTDGPTCLRKFTIVAASLGLKTTREQLRKDFEQVVRSNGLVADSPGHRWQGAYDLHGVVKGFTYKVFKRYYLAKIQGELEEADIRQAWDDLHYGTGSKRMQGPGGGFVGQPYVARAELQKILTREGEALTDEEVDELLRECRPDNEGRVVYNGYRRMLIDPSL